MSETSPQDPGWETYWTKHGERLIWESWIQRYGDFIDPNYLKQDSNQIVPGKFSNKISTHLNMITLLMKFQNLTSFNKCVKGCNRPLYKSRLLISAHLRDK